MAHRHYGLRETKPPATDGGPLPSDAWRIRTAHSMTLRGPDGTGSTPRSRRAYSGVSRGPAWSARALVAVILAIVAVGLVIWFAVGG
jgi:hypothetical protein